jgi:hypothetical protein
VAICSGEVVSITFVVVVTLAAQWLFGAWWIDGVGSLPIVWILVKEGRKAWSSQACAACLIVSSSSEMGSFSTGTRPAPLLEAGGWAPAVVTSG